MKSPIYDEKVQLIKFESLDVLEEQIPKQIEKDEYQPFRLRRAAIEARLSQKENTFDNKIEEFDERNFRFAGEEKMGVVIGSNEENSGAYNEVDVVMANNAQISLTSRGDFTMRDTETTNRATKKGELVTSDIPDSMIFKLLQGKKMERIECNATNCYNIDVNHFPSLKEMEDRADILAKLLILYNKDEYPIQGEVGVGNRHRNTNGNYRANGVGNLHPQGIGGLF